MFPDPVQGERPTGLLFVNFSYGDRIDYVLLVKGGAWPWLHLSVNIIANIENTSDPHH